MLLNGSLANVHFIPNAIKNIKTIEITFNIPEVFNVLLWVCCV